MEKAELTASDSAEGGGFLGWSVAVSGGTAVVGAIGGYPNRTPGAAYVFVESNGTWTQQAKLTASDGDIRDLFGTSVAVSGSTVVVGAPQHPFTFPISAGPGAAYVFVESGGTWTQQAKLTASDGANFDEFGQSVAISGSKVVVGAYGSNQYQGAAYVFVRKGTTWTQQAKLTASDGNEDDYFGDYVAASDSTLVVGAPNHSFTYPANYGPGAAYVFVESDGTWSQQAELNATDGAPLDHFGWSVGVSGGTAVAGAPGHTVGSNLQQGAAYVFARNGTTWNQQTELTASDGKEDDGFANSVAVSDSTVVVGTPGHTVGSNQGQGAGYVFTKSGGKWSQLAELTASDGKKDNYLGFAVAVDGSTAAAGAPYHPIAPNYTAGAAYVFVPGGQTAVTLSTTAINFGKQALGETTEPRSVAVRNTGTTTLEISSITVSGDFAISASTCGPPLAVGQECKVHVTFTPTQLGTLTGTLTFTDNAPNSPQTVALSGAGG
jgi:hypothetical protein